MGVARDTVATRVLLRRPSLAIALVWVFYAALLLFAMVVVEPGTPAFFPAAGVTLVGFLVVPRRRWPVLAAGIVAVEVAIDVAFGLSPLAAVTIGVANVVEPSLAALILARLGMDWRVSTVRDGYRFFAVGALAAAVSSMLGATGLSLIDGLSGFLPTAARWWAGDWLGQIAVAPALLALLTLRPTRPSLARLVEAVAFIVGVGGLTYLGFGTAAHGFGFAVSLGFVLVAFRFGRRGVCAAGAGSAFVSVIAAVASATETAAEGIADSLLFLDAYLAVSIVTAHLLAASLHDKELLRRRLHTQARSFEALFHGSPVAVIELTSDAGLVQRWNPAAERLFGWRAEEVVGRPLPYVPPGQEHEHERLRASCTSDEHGLTFEATRVRRDGTTVEVITAAAPITPIGAEGATILAAVTDVTERKRLEAQLHHAATHDALTGLVNRSHATEHLERVTAASPDEPLALLFIDLDGFKSVNDTHGHHVGDDVLCVVAARVRTAAGPHAVTARWGGDEFLVIAPAADDVARTLSRTLTRAIERPIELPDLVVHIGASIGIALHHPAATAADLLQAADASMYALKRSRRRAEALRAAHASRN